LNPVTKVFEGLAGLWKIVEDVLSPITPLIEAVTDILNPFLEVLRPISITVKVLLLTLMTPILLLAKAMRALYKLIEPFIDMLDNFVGWIDDLIGVTKELTETEEERLNRLNEAYKTLLSAMKEQEEYYLQKKQEINAEKYGASIGSVTSVNDMILTPHGNFSTAPDDYIIATKNPSNLGKSESSNLKLNVKIENTVSNIAEVETRTETDEEGNEQLVVSIIQRVANAIATGMEGMDNALNYRESRLGGRFVTV